MKYMKANVISLGPLGTNFFAWAQARERQVVRTGDLVKELKLSSKQERNLFYNLSSSGLILKLWRGVYLVPEKIPPKGKWTPSPYLIINTYMNEFGAKFQVSGPVVFNSYGFSTQLAAEFFVYNDKVSKKVNLLQHRFFFVKVTADRLGDTKEFSPYQSGAMGKPIFSSLERALFDAVYDYKKYGTLPEAYTWIENAIENRKASPKELARITSAYGNTMSKKRIGWLFDKLGVEHRNYRSLLKEVPKNKFLVPLDPRNSNGPINKKWGVIENVEIRP